MGSAIVPKRAKQAVIPFQLYPDSNPEEGSVQRFTYITSGSNGVGVKDLGSAEYTRVLGIYPDSYELAVKQDISMKHLYPIIYNGQKLPGDISFSDIVSTIPKITIREYIPDPRIDSAINFMTQFYAIITGIFEKSKDKKKDQNGKPIEPTPDSANTLFDKIGNFAKWAFEYITGTGESGQKESLWKSIKTDQAATMGNAAGIGADDNIKQAIFNFPFTLYYLFQSSLTTNVYEFPFVTTDGKIYASSGHEGWTTGSNEFSITGLLGKVPIAGTLLKNTLGNISVNYLPWWDAEAGHKTAEPDITVKFHLFNDNIAKAVTNFICVNTLIANNKWIQYNLFQHSSSLYEVKLDGSNRLFACTMNAVVRGIGNFRTPPQEFSNQIKKHCDGLVSDAQGFSEKLISDGLVKIPDVYEVELTFKSILPANFNNFIYQYSADTMDKWTSYRQEQVTPSLKNAVKDFKDKAVAEFKKSFGGSASNDSDGGGKGSDAADKLEKATR